MHHQSVAVARSILPGSKMSNGYCLHFNPNPCAGSTPGAHPLEEAVQHGGQPGQAGHGLDLMVCSLYFSAAHLQ